MPNTLSGGQQQRVSIARALASKPAIILADEPTGNLDHKTSDEVIELLRITSQKFQQTIVMITHNPEIASQADRCIRIEDGKAANMQKGMCRGMRRGKKVRRISFVPSQGAASGKTKGAIWWQCLPLS